MSIRFYVLSFVSVFSVMGCSTITGTQVSQSAVENELFQKSGRDLATPDSKFVTPPESEFDEISKYVNGRRGYSGYDLIACYSMDNSKLRIGGTHHWGGVYSLFIDDFGRTRKDMGTFKADRVDANPAIYSSGSLTFELDLKSHQDGLMLSLAVIRDSNGRVSEQLKCYQRNSGLE